MYLDVELKSQNYYFINDPFKWSREQSLYKLNKSDETWYRIRNVISYM